jgi:hypothetical protein
MVPVHRGREPDHFYFYIFLMRGLAAETYRLPKFGNFFSAPRLLLTPIFWGVRPVQPDRDSTAVFCPYKLGRCAPTSLNYSMRRDLRLQEEKPPARAERSQSQWTLPGQNSKRMIFLFGLVYFVDAYILPTPIFCRRLYFVNAYILSMPTFCHRLYFVYAYILSTAIFCQRLYFVDPYILSTPIFCQRLYFVKAYILSTCSRRGFTIHPGKLYRQKVH